MTVYDSPEHVIHIHGHGGATRLVWIDPPNGERLKLAVAGTPYRA